MVAPIDAKVTFDVEGEPITLRLNFRAIALAEQNGIDLMGDAPAQMTNTKAATLVKCLAAQEHPEFTEDHALAIVVREPDGLRQALVDLFEEYGGKVQPGNRKGRRAKAAA